MPDEPIWPAQSSGAAPTITQRVTLPCGSDGVNLNGALAADVCDRFIFELPVSPSRYRFRIANTNPKSGAVNAGALTCDGIAVGTPAFPTIGAVPSQRSVGVFAAAPTIVQGSTAMPANGSDFVSNWFTPGSAGVPAWAPYQPVMISIGIDSGGVAIAWFYSGLGITFTAAGSAAHFADTGAPNGAAVVTDTAFDVRLEYEFATPAGSGRTRVVACIGDSIPLGWSSGLAGNVAQLMPHEGWFGQAAIRNGFAWVNMAIGGTQTSDWTAWSGAKVARVDLATTPPDAFVIALGINNFDPGVGNQITATAAETDIGTIVGRLRTVYGTGIPIYVCTLLPRNLAGANETSRVAFNNWLRSLPLGITGCFDLDEQIALQATPATADANMIAAYPHPTLGGHQRLASAVALPRAA